MPNGEDFILEDIPVGTRVIYPNPPIKGLPNREAAIRYAVNHPLEMEPLYALLEPDLRVTTIYPGRIDTEMQRDLVAYEGGEYRPERFLRPETVAKFVADAINAPADAEVHEIVVRPR